MTAIEFYISQGYYDLAAKSLNELEEQFGSRAELTELRRQLNAPAAAAEPQHKEKHDVQSIVEVAPMIQPEVILQAEPIIEKIASQKFESLDELQRFSR